MVGSADCFPFGNDLDEKSFWNLIVDGEILSLSW